MWAESVPEVRIGGLTRFRPTVAALKEPQAHMEACVIQEHLNDRKLSSNELIVSVLLDSEPNHPTFSDYVIQPLNETNLHDGIQNATKELSVESLDVVVVRAPMQLPVADTIKWGSEMASVLDSHCNESTIKSYGFSFPNQSMQNNVSKILESMSQLCSQHPNLRVLQLPISMGQFTVQDSTHLRAFKQKHDIVVFAEYPLVTISSKHKPIHLHTQKQLNGIDIAKSLNDAFNLAISFEKQYIESIADTLDMNVAPSKGDIVLAHSLAHQYEKLDCLEEWIFIREMQLLPQLENLLKKLTNEPNAKKFSFGYSLVIRELLRSLTASIEFMEAGTIDRLWNELKHSNMTAIETSTGTSHCTLDQLALRAAWSYGADVVLSQDRINLKYLQNLADKPYTHDNLASIESILATQMQSEYVRTVECRELAKISRTRRLGFSVETHSKRRKVKKSMSTPNNGSMTQENIKFIGIARATDKAIICCYFHSNKSSMNVDLAECTKWKEMYAKVLRAPTWKTQVTPNARHSLDCDPNKFHFSMSNDELVFAVITVKSYPIRLAFQLIQTLQQEFVPKFATKALSCREHGLDKECKSMVQALATQYDDRTKVDKISEVLHQVDNVKSVMHTNIQVVLSNTEKMEVVEQKTNDLSEQAKVFRNSGRKLRKAMWWKNVKLTIAIGLCAILVIVIILAVSGVFKTSSKKMLRTI
ncbi:unnamed protein product [Albugo candida]|nr:unnamed protein product [Albugo candida]|eukprot:CCI47368.1 unnamed protein product [Albugo candida]